MRDLNRTGLLAVVAVCCLTACSTEPATPTSAPPTAMSTAALTTPETPSLKPGVTKPPPGYQRKEPKPYLTPDEAWDRLRNWALGRPGMPSEKCMSIRSKPIGKIYHSFFIPNLSGSDLR